ncbi:MAG: hypothetical protein AB1898_11280 [Acidobacteriota bacterium]
MKSLRIFRTGVVMLLAIFLPNLQSLAVQHEHGATRQDPVKATGKVRRRRLRMEAEQTVEVYKATKAKNSFVWSLQMRVGEHLGLWSFFACGI